MMTVSKMINYLDREEIAAARERRMRKRLRKLPPKLRKFCLALKRVMLNEKGPEIYIRKKVSSACKISDRTYYSYIEKLQNCCPKGLWVEGVRLK